MPVQALMGQQHCQGNRSQAGKARTCFLRYSFPVGTLRGACGDQAGSVRPGLETSHAGRAAAAGHPILTTAVRRTVKCISLGTLQAPVAPRAGRLALGGGTVGAGLQQRATSVALLQVL